MRIKLIFISYLVLIHMFVLLMIFKTETLYAIKTAIMLEDKPKSRLYQKNHAFYKRVSRNISENSSIFLGDSHIQGLAVSEVSNKAVNFGIGKDTIQGLVDRVSDYDVLVTGNRIILAIGINDLAVNSVDMAVGKYRQLLSIISEDITVVASAVFYINEAMTGINNADVELFNRELKKMVLQRRNSSFVNINKQLVSNGELSANYHIGDGIHLNKTGYDIWISALTTALEK